MSGGGKITQAQLVSAGELLDAASDYRENKIK